MVCVGTSGRGSRCAFVVGCRKRLPRHVRWTDDSSPRPLVSLEIPAARRTGMRLIEIKLRLPMREMACRGRWACSHIGTFVRLHICD